MVRTFRRVQDEPPRRRREERDRPGWARLWPLAALIAGLVLAWAFGLFRYVSFDALAEHRGALARLVADRPVSAALLYLAAYTAAVGVSIPAGPVLTMASGLLFGRWLGAGLAFPAATAGACVLFLVVRSSLAPAVARRAAPFMERLRLGLERDGFWYLLSVRLLPIVPFPVGSIAPALVGMPFLPFAAATALGILPGTVLFASMGAGLDGVLAQGERPDASVVFSPPVLLPLLGLAALSLAAMWLRRRRGEA
jgi:uncharacterized membrane protein YdjX (TVP38/TMEM64 family)